MVRWSASRNANAATLPLLWVGGSVQVRWLVRACKRRMADENMQVDGWCGYTALTMDDWHGSLARHAKEAGLPRWKRMAAVNQRKERRKSTPWAWIEGTGWVSSPGGTMSKELVCCACRHEPTF